MQASLAADFSIDQFSHLKKLLIWHGRLSYKRSAALAQFVVHRGMIISFIQAVWHLILVVKASGSALCFLRIAFDDFLF